jgi:hypothetical protein
MFFREQENAKDVRFGNLCHETYALLSSRYPGEQIDGFILCHWREN